MRRMITMPLFLLAQLPSAALSFSTRMPLTISSVNTVCRASTRCMVATSTDTNDFILREIMKKQAEMTRRKQEALDKVSKADKILQQLESKKKEYLSGQQLAQKPGGSFTESTLRSAVKAFMWRIIAGSVTFYTSLKFSGSLATALTIVGSDFFSKSLTMFIGERLMNKSQAGRKSGADDVGRSLVKALIWRLFAIANTLTMAIFIAKDLSMASKIAGSDAIVKTVLMFVYERAWAKVSWGREYIIEFSI